MLKKIFSYVILPLIIIGLVYLIVRSIMAPVNFNKAKDRREQVAIQRLKDIRTLQNSYKTEKGTYTASIDTLKDFYNNGQIKILMQIGSNDDSLAVENTKALKKKKPKITNEEMYELYQQGQSLVFTIESFVPVKDTLFTQRTDFCVDSLAFIPFSGDSILMDATVRKVSGVDVPLFEADMPYKSLLVGLNNQLRINLDSERKDTGRYPGLQVGSIEAPNNNAGNWE
ncbi:MAG: hypothetical protein LUC24_04990 [Bacteroidales bacterium]|nr:hypothetical protein [Bacteroidales bacterium]